MVFEPGQQSVSESQSERATRARNNKIALRGAIVAAVVVLGWFLTMVVMLFMSMPPRSGPR
jgi:hypothetical protein